MILRWNGSGFNWGRTVVPSFPIESCCWKKCGWASSILVSGADLCNAYYVLWTQFSSNEAKIDSHNTQESRNLKTYQFAIRKIRWIFFNNCCPRRHKWTETYPNKEGKHCLNSFKNFINYISCMCVIMYLLQMKCESFKFHKNVYYIMWML